VHGDRLLGPRVKSFDISVNWCKYSEPLDVIFGSRTAGIALLIVMDIMRQLPVDLRSNAREQVKPHTYKPIHEPEEDNYSHSVIAVFKDDNRATKSVHVSETAKKEFRQIISDCSLVICRPVA
jgi:hypothetical protein